MNGDTVKAAFLTTGCILVLGGALALANPRAAVIATTGPGEGRYGRGVMSPARYATTSGFSLVLGIVCLGVGFRLSRSSVRCSPNAARNRF